MPWVIEMISQYGYIAIFALLALGLVGLPVPDELLTLFVGYLSSTMVLDFSLSVLVCFIGSITGMLISYTIGLRVGQPVVDRYGKWVGLTPKDSPMSNAGFPVRQLDDIHRLFCSGIRHVTSYISGISAMSFRKYLMVTLAGAFIWSLLFVSIGYLIGSRLTFA